METFLASLSAEEEATGRVHFRTVSVRLGLFPFVCVRGRSPIEECVVLYCTGRKSAVDQAYCGRKVWHTRHFWELHRPRMLYRRRFRALHRPKYDMFVDSGRFIDHYARHSSILGEP